MQHFSLVSSLEKCRNRFILFFRKYIPGCYLCIIYYVCTLRRRTFAMTVFPLRFDDFPRDQSFVLYTRLATTSRALYHQCRTVNIFFRDIHAEHVHNV